MTHPIRIGVYRFEVHSLTTDGVAPWVEAAGHTAKEAFDKRARTEIAALLKREPILNDVESSLVCDDIMPEFIDWAAATWNVDPKHVLVIGRRPNRGLLEARAACLLRARTRWNLDTETLARAVGWPERVVVECLRFANGKSGRVVRERVDSIAASGASP